MIVHGFKVLQVVCLNNIPVCLELYTSEHLIHPQTVIHPFIVMQTGHTHLVISTDWLVVTHISTKIP